MAEISQNPTSIKKTNARIVRAFVYSNQERDLSVTYHSESAKTN